MRRTYVDGNGRAGTRGDQTTVFEHNTITGDCSISGNANVYGCDIGGVLSHGGENVDKITIRNTSMGGLTMNDLDTLYMDSCVVDVRVPHLDGFSLENVRFGRMTRNYIRSKITNNSHDIWFDHNTIVFNVPAWNLLFGRAAKWTNNIFTILQEGGELRLGLNREWHRYNCFWGFNEVWSGVDAEDHEPDSTNFTANPRLEWFASVPFLSADSPCIDRADPAYALDTDETRSDMGARYFHHEVSVIADQPSAFDFQLSAFPNPFNSSTQVIYRLPSASRVSVRVFDIAGHVVANLVDGDQVAGHHLTLWIADGASAGLYFCKVSSGSHTTTTKVMLVK